MRRLSWTKFQDFYLRLGFLSALVAVLSPQRRSAPNDAIVRKLQTPLFDSASRYPTLLAQVADQITWYPRRTSSGKSIEHPEVAETLLVAGGHESVLYGITHDTAYKTLDWAHDVELVGRGNQITERGLLLRHLLPSDAFDRFFAGDPLAWNPFILSPKERLYFLFHLVEIDRVTIELIDELAVVESGHVVESGEAARMTCKALFRVLDSEKDAIEPRQIPTYRTARELASTIAEELGLQELLGPDGPMRRRLPKPIRPAARRSAFVGGSRPTKPRHTTKNADHQTIPRVEQLVDLGFLVKPSDGPDDAARLAGRRRWRYIPTDACRRWAEARRHVTRGSLPFQWDGFAATALAAFDDRQMDARRRVDARAAAKYVWSAYETVRRPVGHTPFDSVALFAMLSAVADGVLLEMADCHRLMVAIKAKSALPDHAFFASGNDLDKMFVQLRPGFVEQLDGVIATLVTEES